MDRAQPKLVAGFGPVGHQLQEHLHRRGRGLPSGDGGGTLRASGWPHGGRRPVRHARRRSRTLEPGERAVASSPSVR